MTTSASTSQSVTTSVDPSSQRFNTNSYCRVDPETEKKCYKMFVERCAPQSTQSTISTIHNPMYEYLCSGVHHNPPTRVQAGAKGALHYSSGEIC